MEEEILEKIFIAISENLVACLLIRLNEIPYFRFQLTQDRRRWILLNNNNNYNLGNSHTYVSRRFNLQIAGIPRPRQMDDQHKIDVVLQQERSLYAIEVKAGNSGQAQSPSNFLNVNLKQKVSRDYDSKSGSVASILAHNQRNKYWKYSIVLEEPIQNCVNLEDSWFLCLRSRAMWEGRGFYAHQHGRRFFENCSIFFIDDLVNAVMPETFVEVLHEITPFCQCAEFARRMWLKAGGTEDQWVQVMGQLPRP